MKSTTVAAPILAVVSCLAVGQERTTEPTAFEAFVSSPSVVIEFVRPVGSVSSADAKVEVAALIATDTAHPPDRKQGVRFSLESNGWFEQVYLDRDQLASVKEDLAGIEGGIPELETGTGAPYRVQGTASCWMPARPVRILCPSYRVGPDWSGMTLGAYGGKGFAYPGRRPSELAALIDAALTALEAH